MPTNDDLFSRLAAKAEECFFLYDTVMHQFLHLGKGLHYWWPAEPATIMANPSLLLNAVHKDDQDYLRGQLAEFEDTLYVEFRVGETLPERHAQLTAYRLSDAAGATHVAGWLTDISALKNNVLYAERINARKNSMLEILSHDLKEPIGMINMMAGAIAAESGLAENSRVQSYIKVIRELCDRNIRLIRSLVQ